MKLIEEAGEGKIYKLKQIQYIKWANVIIINEFVMYAEGMSM